MKKILIILIIIANLPLSLISQGGNQISMPSIAVLPMAVGDKDAIALLEDGNSVQSKAANAIGQILTERLLTVIDVVQTYKNSEKLRAQMSGLNSDMNAMIAANTGADIYFEFTVDIIKVGPAQKAQVDIKVYEAVTAIKLGEGGGSSEPIMPPNNDAGSLTKIAARNEMDRILENVRQYWKLVPENGKPIVLTINFENIELDSDLPNGDYLDSSIEDFIKSHSKSYKLKSMTNHTMDFLIYVDYIKYDSPNIFGRAMRKFFRDEANIKVDLQGTGKSIRIQEK